MKKHRLESLKKLFIKRKVLEMRDVIKSVQATTRMTGYKYLKELDYLSSYTHSGKYYTLGNIPIFDQHGIWYYEDIGFSKFGTLMETIIQLVNTSKGGKTNSELKKQQRVYVQNALLSLFKAKKLSREEIDGLYVYFSSDPKLALKQITYRKKNKQLSPLSDLIIIQILIAIIQCHPTQASVNDVTIFLKMQGSSITLEQIERVFQEYSLEKKTLDSMPLNL